VTEVTEVTMERMQTCRSASTPGEVHITWSGHLTPCDLPVASAHPAYDSKIKDVTCDTCGASAVFDLDAAREAARTETAEKVTAGALSSEADLHLRDLAMKTIPSTCFTKRREGQPWGAIKTDFLLTTGAYQGADATDRYVGLLGLAIIDALAKSENQQRD